MRDGDDSQRQDGPTEVDIDRPGTASSLPTRWGFTTLGGAAAMIGVALLIGTVVGWLGSGVSGESENPDLRALCATLGALDRAVLDRIEGGEGGDVGDPNLARLGALPPLATAAASHPDVPEALAETGGRLSFEIGRGDFAGVREQVGELEEYC